MSVQSMQALQVANGVRTARAIVKAEIKAGEVLVSEVLLDPCQVAAAMPVADLLCAAPRWGSTRVARLLVWAGVRESAPVGSLTAQQVGFLLRFVD